MARIPIVNRNDEIIGYKERSEVLSEDIYRVSASWLLNEKGEVLMGRRSLLKAHDPGKWGSSAAGTVEEGETYESNIEKEIKEELGIEVELTSGGKDFVDLEHRFFCQWFYAVIPSDTVFTLQEEEVDEVKWFTRKSLAEELDANPVAFLASMRKNVERLEEFA